MPATASVQQMCTLLVKNQLIAVEGTRALYQRWQSEAKDPNDSEQFRRFLIENKFLTEYQAALVAHGRTEGYNIDEYTLLDRIGQGRMAGVYEAQSTDGSSVAIKVLPPSKARDPQLLARFEREAKMAIQLIHPNVVRTFAVGKYHGLNYMVMERLEGETLEEVLQRRRKLPVTEAVQIVHSAFLGLQHIHEQGMIHRDLKPANLMLVPEPSGSVLVKILDIGLGRTLFDENASVNQEEKQITQEGVLLGTPDYLSPEQARDARSADIRSDIYSLGCVLYHALTGQPPFPDKNVLSQVIRHATEPPAPLREFNPDVPDGLQQVMNFLLAKEPSHRYPTPERAALALRIFLPTEELAASPAAEAEPNVKPQPKPSSPGSDVPVGKIIGTRVEKTSTAKKEETKPAPAAKKDEIKPPAAPAPAPEYDVELVAIPCPPPVPPKKPGAQRSLLEMDRRDFIMFGAGIASALVTVLATVGLVRLVRGNREDKRENGNQKSTDREP